MAFENLGEKLQNVFKQLRSKGKLTEKDVKDAMREVRLALLEADVNFKIVKKFVNNVTEKAIGGDILEGLNPGQQVVKLVHEEMIDMMGGSQSKLTFASKPPTVYMMVGLQGAGKTTGCGKIAGILRKQNKRPLLVACDIYRPAAIKQLQIVGKTYDIPVFTMGDKEDPADIAKAGLDHAIANNNDVVIVDTAGRLHIDEDLMDELRRMKEALRPQEILLVVDAMTGQDAVNVAESFSETLGIDGIIVSKLDSDTRGGAVLSVRAVTGKPVKFVGMGEKLEDMEPFYPDRMASRILGMGDVLSLIDKAQQAFDEKQAVELEQKIRQNTFNLEDFLEQMQQIKKMGSIKDILGMIPGMGGAQISEADVDEKAITHVEAIIYSMTPEERRNPTILNGSRKKRIAAGSGRTIQEVNRLLKQFTEMQKMMKQFTGMAGGSGKKKGKFGIGKKGAFPFF
ncbi:MAG: signal recognition particle protein [Defluviitaleaceae bacterium]|nr:signal recognition particle protein [Defluviitaleaceae bacterium]